MENIRGISAVFFDMDGTLVDSEIYTEQSVMTLCREYGVNNAMIDCSKFDGVSFEIIAQKMAEQLPQLAAQNGIPDRLHEIYHQLLKDDPPAVIHNAREAVIAACAVTPTAVVSSSHRESIEETLRRMQLSEYVSFYVGAEDCIKSKPAPDGYLKAAEHLGVEANKCLVFEDSVPGILAARSAGMKVVAITRRSSNVDRVTALADRAINDFSELEDRFFESVSR